MREGLLLSFGRHGEGRAFPFFGAGIEGEIPIAVSPGAGHGKNGGLDGDTRSGLDFPQGAGVQEKQRGLLFAGPQLRDRGMGLVSVGSQQGMVRLGIGAAEKKADVPANHRIERNAVLRQQARQRAGGFFRPWRHRRGFRGGAGGP